MAKNFSVIKKHQIGLRNQSRNKYYKSRVKTTLKRINDSLNDKETEVDTKKLIARAYSYIDKAVRQGVFAKNQGSRKKTKNYEKIQQKF
uniref:Ribosomal protein S20 n=1 Tax=Neogoniolithon spectabile TaxID=231755 RepID=A0A3G3MGZ9_9FLOR|nr:ribosomal protein S20 [Neogoniolithon spectabile]AYR06072.1 ribosomal protein S20 [Neogoniolithon spectabile]